MNVLQYKKLLASAEKLIQDASKTDAISLKKSAFFFEVNGIKMVLQIIVTSEEMAFTHESLIIEDYDTQKERV